MQRTKILQRLYLLEKHPELYKDLTNKELADFVRIVLQQVDEIDKAIKDHRLDGYTPVAGKDYPTPRELDAKLGSLFDAAKGKFSSEQSKALERFQASIEARLRDLRSGEDGKDALITDEIIEEIAAAAAPLVPLPDFVSLFTQHPEAIRDALELLQDEERLSIDAIAGLREELDEASRQGKGTGAIGATVARKLGQIGDVNVESATVGQALVKQSDGTWRGQTIEGTGGEGSGDMLASTYDPQGIEDDAFDRANHTGAQPASTISDFDTEVGNQTDVAANTAARHTHANSAVLAATTASFTTADETKLDGIEAGATADQSDAEIEAAYNAQVAIVSQGDAEAGTSTTPYRWTPQRIAQAIAALGTGGLQNNFIATTDPAVTDDTTEGYSIGSVWINTTADEAYRCVDNTDGAAVWVKTTLSADELATVAITGDYEDLANKPSVPDELIDLDTTVTGSELNALKTKVDGIEASADVTDAGNVGAVNAAATSKATPVNADSFPIVDSAAGNVIKRLTFTNLKAFLKTYFDGLYAGVLGSDDNYVTDAEKTKLANLSGTNTGDQDLSGYATKTGAETLSGKRVTKRVTSETSSATPTINTDNTDVHRITALAVNVTSFTTNLTGTPAHGDLLRIEITGTGARTLAWGASFEASTVPLPTTTVSTDTLDVGFRWNSVTSKWRCIAVA